MKICIAKNFSSVIQSPSFTCMPFSYSLSYAFSCRCTLERKKGKIIKWMMCSQNAHLLLHWKIIKKHEAGNLLGEFKAHLNRCVFDVSHQPYIRTHSLLCVHWQICKLKIQLRVISLLIGRRFKLLKGN